MVKEKILVTGGAGFIGSELVRQLAEAGYKVIVVDNLANGSRENLADVLSDQVRLVVADIRDKQAINDLLHGVDIIFHLACLGVRHSIHSPEENHEVNATATLKLLTLARDAAVRRFIYISSSEVYGTACYVPMTEEHPTFPMTVYGAGKLAGECYTRAFYKTYLFPTVIVRPFNTYGPCCHHEGDSGEVIPRFLVRCMAKQPLIIFGDGKQTRDFTFVSDTASGIILAGFSESAIGETVNLGSGQEITVNKLAKEVLSIVGNHDTKVIWDAPRPGDVIRLCADTVKAQKMLGFKPKVSLKEGLSKLRDWYISSDKTPQQLLQQEILYNWKLTEVK